MILLLGAGGYVGRAFVSELRRRGQPFIPLTSRAFDYTRFDFLFDYFRTMRPGFLINAASYEIPPGETMREAEREKMMAINAILPQMIARVCLMTKTPWGHVSSGSVFCGAKVVTDGQPEIQPDLGGAETLQLFATQPDKFHGFTEIDEPNASFRNPTCDFYSGTKALAEESIRNIGQSYLWRLRLPFNEHEDPFNWIWRVQRQGAIQDRIQSFSHLDDCVRACLDLWEMQAPFGIYHVTNPGAMTTGHVAREMSRVLRTSMRVGPGGDGALPLGCMLDSGKLLRAGVKLRPLEKAFQDCLDRVRVVGQAVHGFQAAPRKYSAEGGR